MNAKNQARLAPSVQIFKALAHSTRLFIVERLAERAHCVCELTELIGADMSTVSKHLAVLKNAGVIQDEKRGAQVYYHLRAPCVLDFMKCAQTVCGDLAKRRLRLMK